MLEVPGKPKVYIIRNSRLEPTYEQVRNKLLPIASRSLASLVRTQGLGDLYRIYLQTCRDKLDFNLAFIPADFAAQPEETFDGDYMNKLFDLAYERAKAGYPWEKAPPGLDRAPVECQ